MKQLANDLEEACNDADISAACAAACNDEVFPVSCEDVFDGGT